MAIQLLSATTLIDDPVRNANGEDLGHIEDLMVDIKTGCIAYAVLSFGGMMGLGDKLFAIPWEALSVDTRAKHVVLNVRRETLENAPGFEKDDWPDMTDLQWGEEIHNYYGLDPYWSS